MFPSASSRGTLRASRSLYIWQRSGTEFEGLKNLVLSGPRVLTGKIFAFSMKFGDPVADSRDETSEIRDDDFTGEMATEGWKFTFARREVIYTSLGGSYELHSSNMQITVRP